MASPTLSIITVNLNNANGLKKTIESVICQSFKDFEYLIIDGDSQDGSIKLIQQYKTHIAQWISEKDTGIYQAMNKGIRLAKGEFLLFINSGDTLVDKEVLMNVYENFDRKATILYGDVLIEKNNEKVPGSMVPEKISLDYMMKSTLMHPSTFIKKELFEKCGLFNEKLKIAADYEFFLKTTILSAELSCRIPFPVAVFDRTGLSSMPENRKWIEEERKIARQNVLPPAILEMAEDYIQTKETHIKLKRNIFVRILKKLHMISDS